MEENPLEGKKKEFGLAVIGTGPREWYSTGSVSGRGGEELKHWGCGGLGKKGLGAMKHYRKRKKAKQN